MSSYDDEKNNLKSIFGDNKYPTGNNFAELINLPDFRLAENNDGTITVNNVTYDMTKSDLGSIAQISEDFDNLPNGLTFVSVGQNNAPEPTHAYWVRTFNSSAYGGRKLQIAQSDSSNNRYIRTYNGSWNSWDSLATGSELNTKVTDNKNGSITVDGAVFNLLNSLSASSIPQDPTKDYNTLPQGLALMSEINGEPANMPPVKSTYLTLTIASSFATGRKRQLAWLDAGASSSNNNSTYIRYCVGSTWSSWDSIPTSTQISSLIPSTIADTTKLANFTAGLQSGGVSVATSDDLKSVEKSAWHQLDSKYISISDYTEHKGLLLYKINESNKTIDFIYSINGLNSSIEGAHTIQFDFSSIVKGLKYTYQDGDLIGIAGFFDDENNSQNEIRTIVSNVSGAKVSYNFPSTSLSGYGCAWALITSSLSQSADVASLNYTEILN